jgi:hypothetical protein
MGFEPTTFCMASKARGSAEGPDIPAKWRVFLSEQPPRMPVFHREITGVWGLKADWATRVANGKRERRTRPGGRSPFVHLTGEAQYPLFAASPRGRRPPLVSLGVRWLFALPQPSVGRSFPAPALGRCIGVSTSHGLRHSHRR